MSEPTLYLRLEQMAYRPGDVLRGAFSVVGGPGAAPTTVEVSLLWHTEGKGDEDAGVGFVGELAPAEVGADATQPRAFEARLPRTPLSYDGVIVKIHWRARVRVRWADATEVVGEVPFQLGDVTPAEAVS
jgi:hypothetical protein